MAHDLTITPHQDLAQMYPTAQPLWAILLDRSTSGGAERAVASLRLLAEASGEAGPTVVGVVLTETDDLARYEAWGVDA